MMEKKIIKTLKMSLEGFNPKSGKKDIFKPTVNEGSSETCIDNEEDIIKC